MSNYLSEAFKKLDILDEDIFEVDKDGLTALKDFEDSDDEEELITVVDPDAEDEEELEDSYIGKVILDCSVCHTDIYKDKEDVTIDDESGLANIGEECPYCYSSEGFKVIGEVKPFVEVEVDTDNDVDVEVDGEEVEEDEDEDDLDESLKRKTLKEDKSKENNKRFGAVAFENGKQVDSAFSDREEDIARWIGDNYYFFDTIKVINNLDGKSSEMKVSFKKNDPSFVLKQIVSAFKQAGIEYSLNRRFFESLLKRNRKLKESCSKRKSRKMKESYNDINDALHDFVKKNHVSLNGDTMEGFYFEDESEAYALSNFMKDNGFNASVYELDSDDYYAKNFDYNYCVELDESLKNRKLKKIKESILSEAKIKKSWKKIDTVDAEVLDRTRIVAPNAEKYGFYRGEIDFEGTRLPKKGTKLKVDIYDISDDPEWRQYGDEPYYSVINKTKPVRESIEDITIDTGDQEITVSAKDKEEVESDGEMIAPLSDEVKADIETGSDDTVDVDVDEFSEEDFDELGESYLKKVYENVESYKTTSAKTKGNKLYLEGLIKFNSGKQKKTSFVFESKTITKTGKAKLIGENLQISRGHKSFKLTGTINNGKFISESLNYNYRVKNGNESQRVYGTAKKSK